MFRKLLETILESQTVKKLSDRLTVAAAVWLAVTLAFSVFVVWAFAGLTEEVLEGDSRRFDRAVLLWIHTHFPAWLGGPMRLVTALGYYDVVLPLLAAAILFFYLKGWRLSATLLLISTAGSIVLTTVLKAVFQRSRPEVFDSGYTASFYSFPSGHATVAVGFYGMLTILIAYRLKGEMGGGGCRGFARVADRVQPPVSRGPLPDGYPGWLPRRPFVGSLRRRCVRYVAVHQGAAKRRVSAW